MRVRTTCNAHSERAVHEDVATAPVSSVIPAGRADMSTPCSSPNPEGLTIDREIQQRVRPTEIILSGSRADGSHSPSSDVRELRNSRLVEGVGKA